MRGGAGELDAIPSRDMVVDATIAIQAFVLNAFGCLDNLAWIWVEEKPVTDKNGDQLNPTRVGLGKKSTEVRASFSPAFVAYLDKRQSWVDDHLKGFRDALAHSIPLYIPPFIVDPKHIDEYNRLETESGAALGRFDFHGYDKLQTKQKELGFYQPLDDALGYRESAGRRLPSADAAGLPDHRRIRQGDAYRDRPSARQGG
jgi:hypothetical protein